MVSQFEPAILLVLRNEGGYCDVKADKGGETYRGISRTQDPEWSGWPVVDAAKKSPDYPGPQKGTSAYLEWQKANLDSNQALQGSILPFYRAKYWDFDGIENQDVAYKVLDMCVDMGPTGGMLAVQRAVQRCAVGPIVVDGKYGAHTEAAINAIEAARLLQELRFTSAQRYVRILLNDSSQEQFIDGWLERAVLP